MTPGRYRVGYVIICILIFLPKLYILVGGRTSYLIVNGKIRIFENFNKSRRTEMNLYIVLLNYSTEHASLSSSSLSL